MQVLEAGNAGGGFALALGLLLLILLTVQGC
jgi:hypothetical protein